MLKKASSPYLIESDPDPIGEQSKRRLGPIAARVLMKIRYAVRAVRLNLVKGIQQLPTRVAT